MKNKRINNLVASQPPNTSLHDFILTMKLVWDSHHIYTFVLVCLTILQGCTPILQLWIWKYLLDAVSVGLQSNIPAAELIGTLLYYLLIQATLNIVNFLLNTTQGVVQQLLGDLLQNNIKVKILEKANSLELSFFENSRFYDSLQSANQEAGYRPLQIVTQVFSLIQSTIAISFMIFALIRLHWFIPPVILITFVPFLLVQNHYGYANYWMLRERIPDFRKQYYVGSLLTNNWIVKEVRSLRLEQYFLDKFRSHFDNFFKENKKLLLKRNYAELVASLSSSIGWLISTGYVIYRIAQHSITIGDLSLYLQAILQTQNQIRLIMENIGGLYANLLFMSNLHEFLSQSTRDLALGRKWNEAITKIEFRHVSFCYPGTGIFVLKDVSFVAQHGDLVAILGKNGSGKTTLVKLLCCLYEPTSGEILINDENIRNYSPQSVQEYISVIFQDYGHYHFTAQENIGVGRVARVNDFFSITQAALQSGIHQTIDRLPGGYKTMLGGWFDKGHDLSIGEWQKIALARAFLRKGSVVLLDEPTASLDVEGEYRVFTELSQHQKDQITFVVSHRYSTVRMASRILVFDQNRIVESGTHKELMQQNGRYAQMFKIQADVYQYD